MRDFWLVLGTHLRLTLRGVTRRRRRGLLGLAVGAAFFAAIGVGMTLGAYLLFYSIGQVLSDYPGVREAVIGNTLLGWGLLIVVFVLMNAMTTIYATVYGSEDIAYLLSTPLNPRSLFGARLAESFLNYVAVALPATFGPFLAFGLVSGAGALYYLGVGLGYAAYLATAVGAAALFITVVVAYIPGNRLKRLLMMSGLAFGLIIVMGMQYLSVGILHAGDRVALLRRLGDLSLGSWPVLPHVWLARLAIGLGGGGGASGQLAAAGYLGLLVGLAVVLTGGLVWSAATVYVRGWAGLQDVEGRWCRRRRNRDQAVRAGRSRWANPFWAVARKDLLISLRYSVHWYMMAIGVILIGFQVLSLTMRGGSASSPAAAMATTEGQRLFVTGLVAAGTGLGAVLMAGSGLSREGDNVALVRTWPIEPLTLFWAKVCAALPVPLSAATVALLGISRITGLQMTQVGTYIMLAWVTLPVVLVVLLVLDTLMPNFNFSAGMQPGSNRAGGTVFKTLLMVYSSFGLFAVILATFGLPGFYERVRWLAHLSPQAIRVVAYSLFGLETLGVALLLPPWGARRIARMGDGG
jgi:ABC-2 type transport system permease protein